METEVKETKTDTETKTKTETKDVEAQEQWDKERQRADQAESTAEKAREEARSYAEELGETRAQLQQMETQLESFQKETQSKEDALAQMDTALVDSNVITNVEKLNARDAALSKQVEDMAKKIADLETEKVERVRQSAVSQAREDVLSRCDEEFSPKFRTAALKIADKLVDGGDEEQPQDRYEGYILMKKCYQQVSEKEESKTKTKTSVSVDSGKGGVTHTTKTTRKTGTMKEVLADMQKDQSWRT